MRVFSPFRMTALIAFLVFLPMVLHAQETEEPNETNSHEESEVDERTALEERVERTQKVSEQAFTIAPYRLNYILPYTYTSDLNREVYDPISGFGDNLKDYEVKFQLSLLIPITEPGTFVDGDGFFFSFTMKSFWQLYAKKISAPFRDTNYRPEFFYYAPLNFMRLGGGEWSGMLGLEHESNGRTQGLSRSWNRVFAELLWAKGNGLISFRPWYRIPEDPKDPPESAEGDDNPDIEDFMGHFEMRGVYQWPENGHELSLMWRQNFSEGNHGLELNWTFPLWKKLRGMIQVYDGYGENLLDYDVNSTRVGIGIAMSELL